MYLCTFFGHRDTTADIEPILWTTLVELVEKWHVTMFMVGNQGGFDRLVLKNLKLLQEKYPEIDYAVVLAYMPAQKAKGLEANTLCPYVFERISPRFAIVKRNRWLVDKADFVVTYVTHPGGGAAQFKALAEKQGKTVVELANRGQGPAQTASPQP